MSSRLQHHTPQYQASIGNFGLSYHLEMLKDTERVGQIRAALDEVLEADSIHCELGIGTGVFVIYAASKCRKVYAVERDPQIFAFAQQNIAQSPYAERIELIQADALDFRPKEKVDSLLVEMMSIWGINEPQIPIMNHALRHILKPDGTPIPNKIINLVELGHYDFEVMGTWCPASVPQFTGIGAPRIMTQSSVFNTFDFREICPEEVEQQIEITSLMNGKVNCARLSSLVQLSEQVCFYSTDSLMPLTIVPLPAKSVSAGESLLFQASFKARSSIEESRFSIQ